MKFGWEGKIICIICCEGMMRGYAGMVILDDNLV